MRATDIAPVALSAILPGCGHIAAGRAARGLLVFFLFGFAIDGWFYAQARCICTAEAHSPDVSAIRYGAVAFGLVLWAFAVGDTARLAIRHHRRDAHAQKADAHVRAALIALLRDDHDAALRELLAARKLDPLDPATAYHLGVVHAAAGRVRKARRAFHHCIRLDREGLWEVKVREQLRLLEAPRTPRQPTPPTEEPATAREDDAS